MKTNGIIIFINLETVKYNMKRKVKDLSFDELSKLIIAAIEDEQYFNKEVLIPKIRAIMKGFSLNLNVTRYNKIETPSDSAKRLRSIEINTFEKKFWQQKCKILLGEKIKAYYEELEEALYKEGLSTHK